MRGGQQQQQQQQQQKSKMALTLLELVTWLAAQSLGEILAVPHQQLLLGLHGPAGVEVDVTAILARHQVLFGQRVRWVDIAHPVAALQVIAIDEVV